MCFNGHHWVQRQVAKAEIAFEAMDNGFATCEDPKRLQRVCDRLFAAKIEVFVRKWLRLPPHPLTPADRRAGYRYDISVLQAEFSLTQCLDRPLAGRMFLEEVIRENLDAGRHLRRLRLHGLIEREPGTLPLRRHRLRLPCCAVPNTCPPSRRRHWPGRSSRA